MKLDKEGNIKAQTVSLPTRGAWIEIWLWIGGNTREQSLPTRGAWIEMPMITTGGRYRECRSPHGERGLKFQIAHRALIEQLVAPHTGSVD